MRTSQGRERAGIIAAIGVLTLCCAMGQAWAAGELLWTRLNPATDVNLYSIAHVAVDLAGNMIVVTTDIEIVGGIWNYRDYVTVKYDAQGNKLWMRSYNGPAGRVDIAAAVAVDASLNVLVTGMSSDGISGEPSDIATIKYDPDGNVLWVARYRNLANGVNSGNAIAVDGAGNVYVAGGSDTFHSAGCPSSLGTQDFVTIKYGPQGGAPLWVRTYDGPGARLIHPSRGYPGCSPCPSIPPFPELVPGWDSATALVLDAYGNVLVTGSSQGVPSAGCTGTIYADANDCNGTPVPEDCNPRMDYATVKYTSDGQELWAQRYDGPAHLDDSVRGMAVDAAGNVFVIGKSWSSATGDDYVTVKYSASGAQQWVRTYAGNGGNRSDWPTAIAVDGAGRVTVTGSIEGTSHKTCISPDQTRDIATVQYDGNGNVRWVQVQSASGKCTGDYGYGLATDANANVIVVGKLGGGSFSQTGDYGIIKYNSSGTLQWLKTYLYGKATGVAIGSAGHVHVAGPPLQPGSGLRALKYNP